ncbi:hypothetical protein ACLBXO_31430 [Methylobacterium sp. C33D]
MLRDAADYHRESSFDHDDLAQSKARLPLKRLEPGDRRLMCVKRLMAAAVALFTAVLPVRADQILDARWFDNNGRATLPGGPTLGTYQNGKITSQSNAIQIQGTGSAGKLSETCFKVAGSPICRQQRDRWTDNQVQAADFGVKCDGITDDGNAILDATNLAAGLGGRNLVFPSGICRLLTHIEPASNTRWVSRGGTTIYLDPAMATGYQIGGRASGISFDGVSNILIDGITFAGGGQSAPTSSCTTTSCPRVIAQNTSNVVIRNSTFRDFGPTGSPAVQALLVFGGHDWLVDNSTFKNSTSDNLAFSNGTYNVEVRGSTFANSMSDSALVCAIGGYNFNFHDNYIIQGQQAYQSHLGLQPPVVVMDRCHNWQISNNQIIGTPDTNGGITGQGVRVARYADTTDTNHDFTISNNTIFGTYIAISVESAGTVQGSQSVPGGGRFSVTANTALGPAICMQVTAVEMGSINGNACMGVTGTGLLQIAYSGNTGSLAIGTNTFIGKGVSGSFGIRQLAAGGTITPSAMAPQMVSGFTTNYALDPSNIPLALPVKTRGSTGACTPGEINLKADGPALEACAAFGTIKSAPLQ